MSLIKSICADDNSDDILFENSTCTIDIESSAFDPSYVLELRDHSTDGYSMKPDHVNHAPIVLNHKRVTFEDQQLASGSSGANDKSATDKLQQHIEQSVTSDSGECHDRSVLDLKSDILGIITRSSILGLAGANEALSEIGSFPRSKGSWKTNWML
jgi:hypothetical protein